jgi:acetylornithine deacetylase
MTDVLAGPLVERPGDPSSLGAADANLRELLIASLGFPSVSGTEGAFTRFIADWASKAGFEVDLWQSNEADLASYRPAGISLAQARHLPLQDRPTLVITLRGQGGGPSLLFNAHADVVAAPEPQRWRFPPFDGVESGGRIYGRGACDVKGPLVAAMGAMLAIKQSHSHGLAGDLSLELIPGEEDCVGLGTLTSLHRGHRADGVIILEPTENLPRCASRGGCRFEITAIGTAVHGTCKWLGDDAIQSMRAILDALQKIESDWNDRSADPLFAPYPFARPITVDSIHGGQWQGMVCDRCTCCGYLELLPGDNLQQCQARFKTDLLANLAISGKHSSRVTVDFSEVYGAHRTSPDHAFCKIAETTTVSLNESSKARSPDIERWTGWSGFNSGCEAGLRVQLQNSPTLVWGPGSLAQAHAVDEFIDFLALQRGAALFTRFAELWCS